MQFLFVASYLLLISGPRHLRKNVGGLNFEPKMHETKSTALPTNTYLTILSLEGNIYYEHDINMSSGICNKMLAIPMQTPMIWQQCCDKILTFNVPMAFQKTHMYHASHTETTHPHQISIL